MNEQFIQRLSIDWNKIEQSSYLRDIEAIKNLEELVFEKPITFFVGENGSGKSTLLEALAVACGFNPEGGTKNYSFSTYDSHSQLYEAIRLFKGFRKVKWGYFLRAESFLALAQNQLRPDGLYLFDEPEAALSPQRQLTLLMEIVSCARQGSQFIIVTHSPILLGIPDAQILSFDEGTVHECKYEDTESYKVTEMFINNREILLERLLSE